MNGFFYSVLEAYGLKGDDLQIESFGNGLINHTWKVADSDRSYILQRINHEVFKEPGYIAGNIQLIASYLKHRWPEYQFVAPLNSLKGEEMIFLNGGYYRLFPFVPGSHSSDVVETPELAYEAATQFGRFTKLLSGFDTEKLQLTLPFFHDLGYRYQQFQDALQSGNNRRITESASLISFIRQHENIVTEYESIKENPAFRKRVTHHDTKISNVLFNASGKSLCVIDLDTVMPGYFISDVGDMMRTYLSPVNEEERDFSKITIRDDIYFSIVKGYYEEMETDLTEEEKKHFFYSGASWKKSLSWPM
ncbi:MAG: aminoglycoside phosphotransferase family protein [Sediminibacterium sp.]